MAISAQQFKQMQERVSGTRRTAVPVLEETFVSRTQSNKLILGIDPSLRAETLSLEEFARLAAQWMAPE